MKGILFYSNISILSLSLLLHGGCAGKKAIVMEREEVMKPVERPFSPPEVLIPDERGSAVDLRVLFTSGSVNDPPGKEGLTHFTAMMIARGGTAKHTYFEIINLLYPMAASIGYQVDKEVTVFTGRVHRDHIETYLPILFEVLLQPGFREDDFMRIKDEILNYLRSYIRQSNDELLSREAVYTWLYEDHPYGHLVEGTVKGVENITLDDVKGHYRKVFTRDRVAVGLGGAVDDALLQKIKGGLKALPEKGIEKVDIPPVRMPEGVEVTLIEKRTDSSAITFAHPVEIRRGHPDFYPLMLAFSCLGEHRQSFGRLFRKIRERRGLNYGSYSYIEHFIQEGYTTKPLVNVARSRHEMSVWLRPVQHKHRLWALKLALHEVGEFIEKGLSREEFERTRGFLMGYTRILEEEMTRRVGYALDDIFYRTPPHLQSARERFATLTLEEVNSAIKRHISLDNLKIVIVTEGTDELKEHLVKGTAPPVVYDTPKAEEILEEDKVISKLEIKVPAEKIRVIPVERWGEDRESY